MTAESWDSNHLFLTGDCKNALLLSANVLLVEDHIFDLYKIQKIYNKNNNLVKSAITPKTGLERKVETYQQIKVSLKNQTLICLQALGSAENKLATLGNAGAVVAFGMLKSLWGGCLDLARGTRCSHLGSVQGVPPPALPQQMG